MNCWNHKQHPQALNEDFLGLFHIKALNIANGIMPEFDLPNAVIW